MTNPLTLNNPTSVVVKIVFSAASGGLCNAGQLPIQLIPELLARGGAAWSVTAHQYIPAGQAAPTRYQLTETPFYNAELSATEYTKLVSVCDFIQRYASGFGVCKGCEAGARGAQQLGR